MVRLRGKTSGFTLLELIIVVIVIGILASIALPRYLQVAEKGRIAEAKQILGTLRAAQLRYVAQHGHFTADIDDLDVGLTATRYFQGDISFVNTADGAGDNNAEPIATATRLPLDTISTCPPGYVITITQEGTMTCPTGDVQKLI